MSDVDVASANYPFSIGEINMSMRNRVEPNSIYAIEKKSQSFTWPEREAVSDDDIDAALGAGVPGGAKVYCWLPMADGHTVHQTARDVMRAAIAGLDRTRSARSVRGPNGMASAQVEKIASAVMQWGKPHFKHMVAFSTLCEAIEGAVCAPAEGKTREALTWAIAQIERRNEYDSEDEYKAALAKAHAALSGEMLSDVQPCADDPGCPCRSCEMKDAEEERADLIEAFTEFADKIDRFGFVNALDGHATRLRAAIRFLKIQKSGQ